MPVRELPKISWRGQTYIVDARLSQLRNIRDLGDFLDFDKFEEATAATLMNSLGAGKVTAEAIDSIKAVNAYDAALGRKPRSDLLRTLRQQIKHRAQTKSNDLHQQQE